MRIRAAGGGRGQALLKVSRWQRRIGSASLKTGRWARASWGRDTPVYPRRKLIGTQECAAPRPGARGQSGPVRQPSLKTARERDGCVVIPIRFSVFPIKFARAAGSRRLFAGCAALRLASDQAVIRTTDLQGRGLT